MSDYKDRLRRIAVNDPLLLDDEFGVSCDDAGLDAKTLAIARLASLVAVGGSEPSFGEHADAALSAGATTDEIVAVLIGIRPVVGTPRVVTAAPLLALALGLDVDAIVD
ncbi:MAG TPA: carboxymuconolactone decarboxylase family protein [Microbacterium sp.]|uniref:carboxymuconolactone decarboxylase family protein n=1 Tax=Microbacterium sp. TaxID=51671 RepID=UPI002C4AF85C|nr:carboxymuconolactone decarboxylase family protein [Microbacterium sp.]HWI32160.1 carboxymuconolactone decarboxylase family protein [Microbacterium sp.]